MSNLNGVLVCNRSKARLFNANRLSIVAEVAAWANPQGRLRDRDLVTDGPGKYKGGGNGGQHHAQDARTAPGDKVAAGFARDLAAAVEGMIGTHQLEKLYVVAEPTMLGLLRNALSKQGRKLVADEVAKDVVEQTPEQIRSYLPVRL